MTKLLRYSVCAAAVLAIPSAAIAQVYPGRVEMKIRAIGTYQHDRQDNRAEQVERSTRTIHIGDNGSLALGNIAGDITITRGRGGDATVEIVKTAHARSSDDARNMLSLVTVDVNESGSRADIRARYHNNGGSWSRFGTGNINVSVAYNVTAPEGARISAESISGSIRVSGIADVSASTISGDVKVSGATRLGTVKSISGSVEVTDANTDGSIESSSVSGDVTLRHVKARRVETGSVSGNMLLDGIDCDRVAAHTTSGDVTFNGQLARNGSYELKAFSGDVHVGVTGGAGFELNANSFSGEVRSDLPITTHGTNETRHGHRTVLSGTYGDGSAVLQITTFSGDIIISKK